MNVGSKEFFINMRPGDIPYWNPIYTFEEQDEDVKQFWKNEASKLLYGVTINGVFIHPWLYWHLNFWHMMSELPDGSRVPRNPDLRDNEWFFTENLMQAEKENKGIFMFGTRRFGKALLNSEILYMEKREVMIGDVLVGDYIYDDSGKLVEVTGVYPQGTVRTYQVTFEDGRSPVCCGDHQWRIKASNGWTTKSLKQIMFMDYTKVEIPITEPVDYPDRRLPIPAHAFGTLLGTIFQGLSDPINLDRDLMRAYLRASIKQKNEFIKGFIASIQGVITDDEKLLIKTKDIKMLKFILRMFWANGWYAKIDGKYFIANTHKKTISISKIEVFGKYPATCITVNNSSHCFLTTNYLVTHNSAIMSSYLARNATMTYNLLHSVVCGSSNDLFALTTYLEDGLNRMHPFLKINRTSNDWTKGVILGVKNVLNERDIHATIQITNVDQGKKSSSLKTAGGTPFTTIYDEVGKFPFLDSYLAGLPAQLYNDRMRGMIIAAGTGGNVERSQDAQKVMSNPSAYHFIVMNYDLLNKHTLNPTWRISKSGVFVPGQMSYAYSKDDTNLEKYLGVDNSPMLRRINIKVTNFERSTQKIKVELESMAKGDKQRFIQQKMAYPLTPDDCFLNANVNRFPVDDALIHKTRLLEEGRRGKAVDIYQIDNNKMGWSFSEKQIASFPFQGGNIDSPVIIYEDPPEEGGEFNYRYVSSLDIYKTEKADTTSLGSFYVFKRAVGINDPFANRIVAGYASRPASSDDFCRTCEILQYAYGARCLMENADRMYEMYLTRQHKEFLLLEDGEKLANRIIKPNSKQNNRLGLSPTVANQRMLYNTVLQYCWEEVVIGYDKDGKEITQKGIYRIDDIELLDEIIAFGPGVNTDRIISFGHALLLARYYDDMNFMPESSTQKMNRRIREERMLHERDRSSSPYIFRNMRIFK